jgi:hypothetical protein
MALVGVFGQGYTVVKKATLDKHARSVEMEICTFDSPFKDLLLNEFRINVNALKHGYPVKAILSEPPAENQERDAYLVGDTAQGAWEGLEGKIVAWNGLSWDEMPHLEAYCIEDQVNLIKTAEGWVAHPYRMAEVQFDSWFAPENIGGDTNILKQCYEYLKTRSEFSGAEDA